LYTHSKKSDEMFSEKMLQNSAVVFPRYDYNTGNFALMYFEKWEHATLIGNITK
jgi:hypothetical protein